MISCQELTTSIASDELANAGWRKRLSIRWHLMMCKHCRCYQRQMKRLGGVVRKLAGGDEAPCPDLEQAILRRCTGKSPGCTERPPD